MKRYTQTHTRIERFYVFDGPRFMSFDNKLQLNNFIELLDERQLIHFLITVFNVCDSYYFYTDFHLIFRTLAIFL